MAGVVILTFRCQYPSVAGCPHGHSTLYYDLCCISGEKREERSAHSLYIAQ